MTVTQFSQLGLRDELLQALKAQQFGKPTPIQAAGIPPALAGRDLVMQAETGSGKTLAYALPLLQPLEGRVKTVRGLVIVPTRELAVQVTAEINRIAIVQGVRALAIYGGQDIEEQIRELREGAAILVGTPGRLGDVLGRGVLLMSRVRAIVLDEADELLDRGFAKDLEHLLEAAPAERQTILASATMPPAVERLVKRWLREPERVAVNQGAPATGIQHFWVQAHPRHKVLKLVQVLRNQAPEQAIVFVAKRDDTAHVAKWLRREGFKADWIHGEMAQPHRQAVMDRFRSGELTILVATDLAARGLDVPGVSHVVNYDVPMNPEIYVHRVGRTGRAGETGIAITLVGSDERFSFGKIRAGFPVKELKGKVEKPTATASPGSKSQGTKSKGPASQGTKSESGKAPTGKSHEERPQRGKAPRGKSQGEKSHRTEFHQDGGREKPQAFRPAAQAEASRREAAKPRHAGQDPELPAGWVLDDEPERPAKPMAAKPVKAAKSGKHVKKDSRPPRAIAKDGPSLAWDEGRPKSPRRGRNSPEKP